MVTVESDLSNYEEGSQITYTITRTGTSNLGALPVTVEADTTPTDDADADATDLTDDPGNPGSQYTIEAGYATKTFAVQVDVDDVPEEGGERYEVYVDEDQHYDSGTPASGGDVVWLFDVGDLPQGLFNSDPGGFEEKLDEDSLAEELVT